MRYFFIALALFAFLAIPAFAADPEVDVTVTIGSWYYFENVTTGITFDTPTSYDSDYFYFDAETISFDLYCNYDVTVDATFAETTGDWYTGLIVDDSDYEDVSAGGGTGYGIDIGCKGAWTVPADTYTGKVTLTVSAQ